MLRYHGKVIHDGWRCNLARGRPLRRCLCEEGDTAKPCRQQLMFHPPHRYWLTIFLFLLGSWGCYRLPSVRGQDPCHCCPHSLFCTRIKKTIVTEPLDRVNRVILPHNARQLKCSITHTECLWNIQTHIFSSFFFIHSETQREKSLTVMTDRWLPLD